jgi:hypothetical protein
MALTLSLLRSLENRQQPIYTIAKNLFTYSDENTKIYAVYQFRNKMDDSFGYVQRGLSKPDTNTLRIVCDKHLQVDLDGTGSLFQPSIERLQLFEAFADVLTKTCNYGFEEQKGSTRGTLVSSSLGQLRDFSLTQCIKCRIEFEDSSPLQLQLTFRRSRLTRIQNIENMKFINFTEHYNFLLPSERICEETVRKESLESLIQHFL